MEFNGHSNTYVLMGTNGSGKSSILEALSNVFGLLYEPNIPIEFDYHLSYLADNGRKLSVTRKNSKYSIKADEVEITLKQLQELYLPSRVICNYSGEEMRIKELYYEKPFRDYTNNLKQADNIVQLKMVFVDKYLWPYILLVMVACRGQVDSFDHFLTNTLHIDTLDGIFIDVNKHELGTWKDNPVSYYIRRVVEFIDNDGKLPLEKINPTEDTPLTLFNQWNSARPLINNIRITYNGGIDAMYFSEGEKKMMVILFILEAIADEKSLVFLDEPDSHIHIARINELKAYFDEIENRQNLLTSHSPALTKLFEQESIIMLERQKDGNAAVIESRKQEIVAQLMGKVWTLQEQNVFLASNNDIILVEGKMDEAFLRKALAILQSKGKFLNHSYEFLPCGGADGVCLVKSHFTPKDGQRIFCLIDSDQAGWKCINNICGKADKFNSSNFGHARKMDGIWIMPYPKGKRRIKDFNIEDYFGRSELLHHVMKFRSLNEIMTKEAIKKAIYKECEEGKIKEKLFYNFALVFNLLDKIRIVDTEGKEHL